jgi:hypothetical protein
MEALTLEDILVYTLLLGILIYVYFKYGQKTIEGFTTKIQDVQTRIQAELTAIRKSQPTFFTQTVSAPILPRNQSFLVNICPLTGYLGGYLGPPEHLMDTTYYLQTAFQAGVRSFVLPISTYVNASKTPPDWPYSGEPVLACRDANNVIISVNGLTINQFVSALLQFKSVSNFSPEPILLYLEDDLSTTDRSKINYVSFMKKIASTLIPLDSYRLTSVGSYGSVIGGVQQTKLLTEIPLATFNNKILIFTNFDTLQDKDGTLGSYANFIYSNEENSPVRNIMLEDIAGSTVNYIQNSRINWHIASSKTPLVAPLSSTVQGAFNNGIQCVPIPLLSTPMDAIKDIWNMWKGASYLLKAESSRYTQPDPVVPSQVNTKLNASIQGRDPGNLVVT